MSPETQPFEVEFAAHEQEAASLLGMKGGRYWSLESSKLFLEALLAIEQCVGASDKRKTNEERERIRQAFDAAAWVLRQLRDGSESPYSLRATWKEWTTRPLPGEAIAASPPPPSSVAVRTSSCGICGTSENR